jgi:flagellar hook assembly protein FlgD
LERPSHVSLCIDDLAGHLIQTLVDGELLPGTHHATWNGRNRADNPVASGPYRYVLRADGQRASRLMILAK